jgi:hypothetical protein
VSSWPGRWADLRARFDDQALLAYAWPPSPAAQVAGEWPALYTWCLAAPVRRLAVAVPAAGAAPTVATRAEACALQLDGSQALHACRSAAAGWRLRLGVKWQDLQGTADAAPSLPPWRIWDTGRARGDAAALARFVPRRPSFLVVDQGPEADVLAALAELATAASGWRHPVRVLWLLPGPRPEGAVVLAGD